MSGSYKGRLYQDYVDDINILMKLGRLDECEKLLCELIAAIEADDGVNKVSSAWYYAQLANVYHRKKDLSDEIKILERFVEKNKGARTTLHERLEKLKRGAT
ncbi:tetratricopeptide repeat protein [Methanocella conradii]|uniref:tetratricopeptide repeat protein n=1 Tax=Methanocella conradii TaxID=1175444 RepID=UPI00157DC9B6|nr:tetratricopeptide repeat protein [Methanocella conradii]